MKHYDKVDKIIYIGLCLVGLFLNIVIPMVFFKYACIDFEMLIYKNIVIATVYIAVLVAIPIITALAYIYLSDKQRDKLEFMEWHYFRKHRDDYNECVELYKIDRGKW